MTNKEFRSKNSEIFTNKHEEVMTKFHVGNLSGSLCAKQQKCGRVVYL